ncbi:HlyD family efflux transporter periplasmic adaptor subunit [Candidatus Nomurabacteria bacterium]|nr:HlyD family efflux transporter periplasmic adaptor subunit [Candidatus Nomurabacteria bacterium]
MQKLLHHRYTYVAAALLAIIVVITMAHGASQRNKQEFITTSVERGTVQQLVSVSGVAEAEQTAELAFPVGGIVEEVLVDTGDVVEKGDIIAKIDARTLYADRQDAAAAVATAVANRDELLSGLTDSARDLVAENLATAKEALSTTKENEAQKIANAYQALLSSGLTVYSNDDTEDATPPTVSGTYTCNQEGSYTLEVFLSKSESGYSYRLSGIETGTYVISTEQPVPLGTCGLRIIFDADSIYNRSVWHIDIPNTKSSSYITNRNAYALAQTQAESAILLAEQAVAVAEADATNQNAPARSEAITRANAAVAQAQARLNRIDATIADRTLRAPFSGTITNIDILPGETVTTAPIVTLLADTAFEVTARIPEIDIGKLLVDQRASMVFDARSEETLGGTISFISPQATEIDGVAYYEAIIQFDEVPAWIRSGLNADIDIIITERTDTLRVPKRFVSQRDGVYEVLRLQNDTTASTTIEVLLEGNDGFVAITGLTEGDILLAP